MSLKRSGLRSNPEKVREFLQRSREKGGLSRGAETSRAPLARSGLKAKRGVSRPPTPPEARKAAQQRSGGQCERPGCERRGNHCHHLLPQREWPELAGDPNNVLWTCVPCHKDHESGQRPFPRSCWPSGLAALAAVAGPGKHTGLRAPAFLDRLYPPKEAADAEGRE